MPVLRWSVLAAVFVAVLPAPATAGPIHWSYYSTGAQDGVFWFNSAGYPLATPAGQAETIFLVGGYGFPVFDFPFPPQGPVLWTEVTIADAESGLSETFDVAVEFYDFEPTHPPDEWEYDEPRIMPFNTFEIDFGRHQYTVANGSVRGISVRVSEELPVSETPEPATVAIAGVGLTVVGLARLRRRRSSPTGRGIHAAV
jgi:MYXO-CTERM domain-containing protein